MKFLKQKWPFWVNSLLLIFMVMLGLYLFDDVIGFTGVFQALFVGWDAEMYDMETGSGATSRTTNISDDLGQIDRIEFFAKKDDLHKNVNTKYDRHAGSGLHFYNVTDDIRKRIDRGNSQVGIG